jgi:hypothetical protein
VRDECSLLHIRYPDKQHLYYHQRLLSGRLRAGRPVPVHHPVVPD